MRLCKVRVQIDLHKIYSAMFKRYCKVETGLNISRRDRGDWGTPLAAMRCR